MNIQRCIRKVIKIIQGIQRSCFFVSSNLLECIQQQLLRSRNCSLLVLCVIAISLDTLFFYLPVISDTNKCLKVDAKLGTIAIVLRFIIDGIYLIHIIIRMRPYLFLPCFRAYWGDSLSTDVRPTARMYLFCFFPIDLLAILPLPQIVILVIIPMLRSSNFLKAMVLLKSFLLFQYVPRTLRIYQFLRVVSKASGVLAEAASTKAALNLLLYLLASHVLGGVWYFFSIERATTCWQKACKNNICAHSSFYCSNSSGDLTFVDNFCPIQTPNITRFDFGIFLDALQSGIAKDVTGFFQKFVYCFVWGLQNLSCFGQNLKTSAYFWENCFAAFIIILGLVLFVSLIGNMQTYLQSKTMREEEMRLKGQEIEHWVSFRKLPEDLKEQVKKYQRYKWREIRGVDVENFLNYLPKYLRRRIMRELCVDLLKKVRMLVMMDEQLLDAMCDRLKPVLYTKESYIVGEGDPVDEMLFIVRGELRTETTNGGRPDFFKAGDLCGEELLNWAFYLQSSNLPISTKTVRTTKEVQAFAVVAEDLKFVASQFWQRHSHLYRFYSQQWRTWAACFIQAAWRRYGKKKPRESLRQEENRLQDALASTRTWAACFIQAAWRRYSKKKLEESLRQKENMLQDALAKPSGNSLLVPNTMGI